MGKWWWIDISASSLSREEQDAMSQLSLTAAGLFLFFTVPQFIFLPTYFQHDAVLALLLGVPTLLLSLFLARPICTALWPNVIKAGDKKAAARLAE
jgi:hypothetical protein